MYFISFFVVLFLFIEPIPSVDSSFIGISDAQGNFQTVSYVFMVSCIAYV